MGGRRLLNMSKLCVKTATYEGESFDYCVSDDTGDVVQVLLSAVDYWKLVATGTIIQPETDYERLDDGTYCRKGTKGVIEQLTAKTDELEKTKAELETTKEQLRKVSEDRFKWYSKACAILPMMDSTSSDAELLRGLKIALDELSDWDSSWPERDKATDACMEAIGRVADRIAVAAVISEEAKTDTRKDNR
jgi:hypothetical protein